MPVQDLIDRLDKALETAYAGPPPKPAATEPAREPAVQATSVRDEADLLSWAENFAATKPAYPVSPVGDARADKERAVRTFKADVPAASGSTFGRNVSKGFLNIGETSLGFFESLTDILGASKAKSWLKEKGDRLDELNRAIPNEIESFTDVENAGDAGAYLAMTIGQLVPQIGTALIGGTAARALTAGASAGARVLGTLAGTVVPSVVQESGGIYRGVRDETGVEAPVTSLTFGAIAGALEAVTPSRFLLKVFDTGTDEIKRKSLASLLKLSAREILKETGEAGVRVGKAAAKTGLTELGTEIGQEAIALGANKFADGTYDLINSKNAVRLIDAGLMGLVGGAALGSVQPSIERAIKYTRQQEDKNAVNERQEQTDVEQERQRIDADVQAQREGRERETALAQARATGGVSDQLPPVGTVQEVTPPVVAPLIQPEESPLPESLLESRIVDLPVASLTLSQEVPQFKRGANKKGIVRPLGGTFDTTGVGPIQVWKRLDGRLEVISGRHRLDLAQRSGTKKIASQVHNEADGFTARDAARLDAILNIRDGQGSIGDYANFFRYSQITQQAAESEGLLADAKGKTGFVIGTAAGEDLFSLHQAEGIADAQAAAIASAAPNDPALQAVGIRMALDGRSAEAVADMMRLSKQRAATRQSAGQQSDLFGFDDTAILEMEAQSALAAKERRDIRAQVNAVKGAAKKPEIAKQFGIDVTDPAGVQKKVAELEARLILLREHPELASQLPAPPQPAPVVPVLRSGEKGTGQLFQGSDAPFNLAGETAVDPTRVAAEKAKAEADAAEALRITAQQQPGLFGESPRGSISPPTPPIPPVPSTGFVAVAFDIPAFKQRVAASNLSPEAKSFINAFLNSKAARYLEGARFRIAEALDGGWEGSYFKGLVEIAETATPGVAPQEFMHRIFDLLPETDKQAIEALRQERLAELNAQYPNDPLLASIAGGRTAKAQSQKEVLTRGQITFETYDEPSGEWVPESRPIVVSKSTIPGDKPWRATVFAGPASDPLVIGHIQLDKPTDIQSPKSLGELSGQLGRYVRNIILIPSAAPIAGAPMTTANFVAANPTDQQIADFYPVTTTDEFFAHMMSDKFVARTKGATSRGLISTIREAIKDLIAAIKKGFRLPVTADEMFRNVINGRYDVTPEGGTQSEQRRGAVVPITRKKTIERVAAFAKPGAERQTEALLATGQVTSVLNIVDRILSATVPAALIDRVGRLVGFERMDAISTYVRDVLGQSPTEYAAARATLTDEGLKNLLAVHTNRAFELFEQNAAKLKALLARQQKKLTGPAWAAKLRDLAKKRSKADATTAAREAMQLALKNGLDRAVKRIQESGGNDATFESAEQERQFYEQLLSRSSEVATAMDSIAKALGFTPDGVSIVFGKKGNNANDILAFYHMMVPLPPADPVTGRNPQFAINRVASEILARNVTLRQQMVAALWTENAALAKPIATFEDKIVHDMQAGNPKTVIGKLIRQAGDLSNTEGKAAAAFMAKYRELLREVEKLEALEEAVRVVDATLVDKQYRAVRVLVATDAKAEIRPQDAKALETGEPFYSTSHIYLPDGTIVELNMFPDKARFRDELTRKLDPALTAINNWLFDPINADNPARAFYQQQYDTFKALWWSSTAVNPPKQLVIFRNTVFKMLDSMLGMLDPMLGSIGTRSTTLAQTAGQVWKDANHKMGDWLAKWNPLIVDSMARAAKSHPAIWEGQSRGAATDEWHSSVFVPLAASVQDPARPGYKVGDVIFESGEVVTQQDMDALELQVASTGASFKIDLTVGRKGLALPNVVEDRFVPGLKFLRRPIAFAKNMMMRRFDNSGRDIGIAFAALKEKLSGQPAPTQRAALEKFWDDHFQYVKSAVVNRNAQYSNLTEFEDVLAAARPEIANGSISNVAELVDFIFGRTLEDPDAITDWLFGELDRHATAIHKATATKADLGLLEIAMVEDQNPFTVGRGGEIAPPAWYSYGFNDSRSIYNFSMSGSNFYFEILIKSLNAVSADLGAEISRQGTAINALATKLGKGKEAQARQIVNRQNQDDIRLGRQTFDLETAADMKRGLDKLILNLNQRFSPGGRRLEEEFGIANKVWGDFISGVLFSSYTLARNALEGGFIQNGFRMSRLFGSTLQGFPRAFLGLMQTFLKVGGAGLWSLPVAAFKLRPIAGARALLTGNVLKAEQTFFGDAIRELATNMFERVQMFRDLEAAGLGMPAYPAETVQASAQYPLTFGQIVKESPMAETPFGRLLQNIGPGLLTFYDAQISLFLRPFFPRVGDQIANLAVANTTLGGIHNLEARIRKLFSVYRAAGVPIASLSTHVFTPSEILGKWFGIERTQTSLREIQQWFHKSLIPFNDSVFDYLTRLEKDPKAVWLTHEEKMRLITTNAEAVNVATPLNRPELFKRNLPMRMVGGLLGWNVSALRNAVNNFTAVAASDPNFSRNQLRIATYTMFLATLAYSALGQAGIEEILRFLSWMLNNEERATRQPWEQEGADQAKQWAVYAFNSIPFVATAVNTAFSDLPNKAGFSPTLLAQQKVIDVLNYVTGAIRTRDVTYRLPQLIRGFVPLAPVVLNRLPATEGTVEALNASRLYRRYGDLDLVRRSTGGPGVSASATRLTPYGDRILNALAQGDYESAEALKAEAVKVATQLGKPDPERSVEQSIVSRLPHRRAFKETPNAAQMARVMAKMSSSERAQVTQLNDTLKVGLDRMGIKTDFVDQPRLTDAPHSRLSGGGLRLDRPRRGRRSRLIGLSSTRRSRRRSRFRTGGRRRQRRLSAFA